MRSESEAERLQLLDEVLPLALPQLAATARTAFTQFLRAYFAQAALDTLRLRSSAELAEIALRHFQFAQRRAPGELLVRVLAPVAGAVTNRHGLLRLETVVDDMPFLVDSLSIAIRDAGGALDYLVHPILHVLRDEQGQWQELADDGDAESLIHIEFDAALSGRAAVALEDAARELCADIRCAVDDYSQMRTQAVQQAESLRGLVSRQDEHADRAEAADLLDWLVDGHFTFLAYSQTELQSSPEGHARFVAQLDESLGLAREARRYADAEQLIAPQEELDKYRDSQRLVVITKAAVRSHIHRAEPLDVISVKRLRADGSVAGTGRYIGLFSSDAYLERPTQIPLVRRKVEEVLRRSALPPASHAGKQLRDIIQQLPRDELFQSSEDELFSACMGIRALRERAQLKLFQRRDRYGRFYAFMVYVPRERYSRELGERIARELLAICRGQDVERNTEFLREGMARLYLIVRTPPGTTLSVSAAAIEARLSAAVRGWRDQLLELLRHDQPRHSPATVQRFRDAFPLSYQETHTPEQAAADIRELERLSEKLPLIPRLHIDAEAPASSRLKLYVRQRALPLSDVLPMLENFGLRVLWEDPIEIRAGAEALWLQQFGVQLAPLQAPHSIAQLQSDFEEAFVEVWRGRIENDGLQRLVLLAGLSARQITVLRTLTRYLLQTQLPYSQDYQERLLADNPRIARLLVEAFELRFDPSLSEAQRRDGGISHAQALDDALDKLSTQDADRVLRAYTAVLRASLRSNYFQRDAQGAAKTYVSIKFDSQLLPELPMPRPLYEIFVYAPEVEGIHLRGGRVARGGLRWSDRRQDFRTEVLGLMKAQTVKNAIIVPVGAKGGFVVKNGTPADREAWQRQGVAAYQTFLRGLLDLTDNRVGDAVLPPPQLVRHDGDDPYLVVAADKGTATFSDIANALAAEYGFWLGDAFASGGSAGYDHKKMGITARGAWESVKRHFRELGQDIEQHGFTVVGVGDMSGDVFGNGMLLSRQLRLLAAFDHRHIFIDPDPDPAASFAERARLFALPRSSWDDYDRTQLSAGGGVYARSAKLIEISPEAQRALGLAQRRYTPQELIRALLCAPVDLLFNGGIGTYVKSHLQAHQDCGDRSNDAVRVNGRELRCKVVGEGGNLGFTQLGRIEYALSGCGGAGGRINTDFIDNAAGVHTSDREVNIKIPLNGLMLAGTLTREQRDPLLASLTEDIAGAVLHDNYVQALALSLIEQDAAARLGEHQDLMTQLERDSGLNRAVEFLPDEETLKQRRAQHRGLSRPELAVLLSYAKIALYNAVLDSEVPDDEFHARDLLAYFPPPLQAAHREPLRQHRLRREIVATILANAVINRMGFAFAHRFAEDHGFALASVVQAYAMAHEMFDGDRYWLPVQALDGQLPAALQLSLFRRPAGLLKHATAWLLDNGWAGKRMAEVLSAFAPDIRTLSAALPGLLSPAYRADWDAAVAQLRGEGVPEALAQQLANTRALGSAPDIVELARAALRPPLEVAQLYFMVGERLGLNWLLAAIVALPVSSRWQALARDNLRSDCYRLHRLLTAKALDASGENLAQRLENYLARHAQRTHFGLQRLQQVQAAEGRDFMTLAVAVRELRLLAQA
ncbi:glutamate dehydrogenase [Solimonas aquatica]|uniref:Glutamate dehydrogenase n=1 Tax=Solimonas aquatica TaxID=489703 RepID=A0A1H9MA57_9GAMM|nr:NAD-glutamate dehydrogenase [Solimonas aquatica]SER20574.1 glutamate dehydrogenase [Solimonas aquatica]